MDTDTHAIEPRQCEPSDLFTVNGDKENVDAFLADCAEYLKDFAAPAKNDAGKPACFHCGETLGGLNQVFGIGVAYQWGLVHGEANCSGCGWPARGIHRPVGGDGEQLFTASNLFLAYHPSVVEKRAESVSA